MEIKIKWFNNYMYITEVHIFKKIALELKFYDSLQLEARLAEKEEHLLEKDLIFEQVNRLVDRVKNKAEGGKEDTLELAKKVSMNGLTSWVITMWTGLLIDKISIHVFWNNYGTMFSNHHHLFVNLIPVHLYSALLL